MACGWSERDACALHAHLFDPGSFQGGDVDGGGPASPRIARHVQREDLSVRKQAGDREREHITLVSSLEDRERDLGARRGVSSPEHG